MIPHDRWIHDGPPGIRLDRALADRYPWLPRPRIQALVLEKKILLDGRPTPKGAKLRPGSLLEARDIPEPADLRLVPNPDLPLRVLWEDDTLLALDKPAGMPTHPLDATETDTLANALIARYPDLADIGTSPLFPAMLHRLDTGTSGLVLAAKDPGTYRALRESFRRLEIEKHYLAWVHGPVTAPGQSTAPLTHKTRTPCRMRGMGFFVSVLFILSVLFKEVYANDSNHESSAAAQRDGLRLSLLAAESGLFRWLRCHPDGDVRHHQFLRRQYECKYPGCFCRSGQLQGALAG